MQEIEYSFKELLADSDAFMNPPKNDSVNHPDHYIHGQIETIDVIKEWTDGLSGINAVCMGNVIKYISRWQEKGGVEDLKKARWYLNRVILETEGQA